MKSVGGRFVAAVAMTAFALAVPACGSKTGDGSGDSGDGSAGADSSPGSDGTAGTAKCATTADCGQDQRCQLPSSAGGKDRRACTGECTGSCGVPYEQACMDTCMVECIAGRDANDAADGGDGSTADAADADDTGAADDGADVPGDAADGVDAETKPGTCVAKTGTSDGTDGADGGSDGADSADGTDETDGAACDKTDPGGRICSSNDECRVSCDCGGTKVDSGDCNIVCATAWLACSLACEDTGKVYSSTFCFIGAAPPADGSGDAADGSADGSTDATDAADGSSDGGPQCEPDDTGCGEPSEKNTSTECCSGWCTTRGCKPLDWCLESDEVCAWEEECCSGRCTAAGCQAPDWCQNAGNGCFTADECCSGKCELGECL